MMTTLLEQSEVQLNPTDFAFCVDNDLIRADNLIIDIPEELQFTVVKNVQLHDSVTENKENSISSQCWFPKVLLPYLSWMPLGRHGNLVA